jgi:MYXO-CTERM domain-containing protein
MSGNQGVWAPDLMFFGGKYLIYYSFCGVPAADAPCAIGLLTTPTLDASSAQFKLTDAGMVLNNPKNDDTYQFSTIDPAPIVDADGNLWVVWGSGYGKDQAKTQIWITRMDNTTGLPLKTDSAYKPPATLGYPLKTGRREGAYMHYHDGYYYLFWNEGSCCSGTSSTYTIWVARSATITGPFTGDKVFYASTGDVHGPGHMGITSVCGVERFTYHYYPTAVSILGENELTWDSKGWPVVGPQSTTSLAPCSGAGGSTGARDAGPSADVAIRGNDGASETGSNDSGVGGMGGSDAGGGSTRNTGGAPNSGGTSSSGITSSTSASGPGGTRTGGTTALPSGGTVQTGTAGAIAGSTTAGTNSSVPLAGSPVIGSGTGGSTSTGNSGCSCKVGGHEQPRAWLLLLFAMVGAAWRRRR